MIPLEQARREAKKWNDHVALLEQIESGERVVPTELSISEIAIPAGRRHPVNNYKELLESIKESGMLEPIWVEKNPESNKYWLVNGLARYYIAKQLGLKTVPVSVNYVC